MIRCVVMMKGNMQTEGRLLSVKNKGEVDTDREEPEDLVRVMRLQIGRRYTERHRHHLISFF
jgi:hypothetical protein